jgi:hypothetical protein
MLHILFAILISLGSFSLTPKSFDEDQKQFEGSENVEILLTVEENSGGF